MAKKETVQDTPAHAITLVFTQRENGDLVLLKRVPRDEAVAYAEQFGAILVDAEQYMPHLG